MELVSIDNSRVIFLTSLRRAVGQPYLPDTIAKLRERYSFVKFPSVDDLYKDAQVFSVGKFNNVQIQDFFIYNDGVIIASKSNTDILDAFLDDVLGWASRELGLSTAIMAKQEKHYESTIFVKSNVDLANCVMPKDGVIDRLNKILHNGGYTQSKYILSGFLADLDTTKQEQIRRPFKFSLERKAAEAFKDNVFFSTAPMKTGDHLAFLEGLERVACRS